jgi:hypothetical protein
MTFTIRSEHGKYEFRKPYRRSFLWWLPFKRTDAEGAEHEGALRYDIDRESFIDRIGDAQFRGKVLTWFKKVMADLTKCRLDVRASVSKRKSTDYSSASSHLSRASSRVAAYAKRKR